MKTFSSKKIGLFRITAADREKLQTLLFKRYPHHEWGTFFRFGYRLTSWGIHVSFVDTMEPRPGDLKEESGIVEFNARYILRAQLALAETKLGMGVIHSHPEDCSTYASSLDNDMDDYFSGEFAAYGAGRPYVSLRIAKSADGRFTFGGEAWVNGQQMPVMEWLTVGGELEREVSEIVGTARCEESFFDGPHGTVDGTGRRTHGTASKFGRWRDWMQRHRVAGGSRSCACRGAPVCFG